MKPTQVTELLANIRKTFVSFFSIFMFVALGIGIFLGISWAGPALQTAANRAFDEGNFHNLQVQFPYGLTDDDLAKLAEIEGVTQVEPARQSFQTVIVGNRKVTVKLQTIGSDIDVPVVVQGELPTASNEIALHAASASSLNADIGDTVTFVSDAGETAQTQTASLGSSETGAGANTTDADGMKYLTSQSFKVTGIVNSPDYLAKNSLTYGFSASPSGAVDALGWVIPEAFDAAAFQNGYPVVNVRCDSLSGKDTFSNEYIRESSAIKERVSELGSTLAKLRYDSLHDQAQSKIDEAQAKLDEGNQKIADGERQLEEGRALLQKKKAQAEAQLTYAKKMLDAGESEYAKKVKELDSYQSKYDEAVGILNSAKAKVKDYKARKAKLDSNLKKGNITQKEYDKQLDKLVKSANSELAKYTSRFGQKIVITRDGFDEEMDLALMLIDVAYDVPVSIDGKQITLREAKVELDKAQKEAREGRAMLDEGWSKYNAGRKAFETLLAEGNAKIADGEQQLAEAKALVAENEPKLEQAKAQFAEMKEYEWTVLARENNAGAGEVKVFSGMTTNLSFSMAALFIIVGLLVSYSAVSRTVHEQITQIGTKKALGLRSREITTSFLAYSGLAVIAGAIVGTIVGVIVVEGIIGDVLASMFSFGPYPPYFGLPLFIAVTLLELALILGTTWLACRGILKKYAVELLRGPEPPALKERFYEKRRIWNNLPLFTQTIVNNCVNDKRRMFSTIVGVAGCTALIVTAITLNNDVLKSYDCQYSNVYNFNAIAYVADKPAGAIDNVEAALQSKGFETVQVVRKNYGAEDPSGALATVRVVVPMDENAFAQLYKIRPHSGATVDLSQDGAWVTQAYAQHFGAKVGDTIPINAGDGSSHEVKILGFYDFWLTYHEMVMGRDYYEREFGSQAPNVVLANTNGVDVADMETELAGIDGFDSISDDKVYQYGNFATFSGVSRAVVAIYLALSILMAIVVLLNLNVMFIEEKKRELIVLMINGFSASDAKRYIYNDNIVLAALGIICGLVLGCIMGSITVGAIEPSTATFVKSVDLIAVLAGTLGSAFLAVIMTVIALRRITRFNLTDINKI